MNILKNKIKELNSTQIIEWRRKWSFYGSVFVIFISFLIFTFLGYELKEKGDEVLWRFIPFILVTMVSYLSICWFMYKSNVVPTYVRGAFILAVFTTCWWILFTAVMLKQVV